MNKENNGGPAFPQFKWDLVESLVYMPEGSVTIRDYFAAKAMQGVLASGNCHIQAQENAGMIAQIAYLYADAMLEERKKDLQTK